MFLSLLSFCTPSLSCALRGLVHYTCARRLVRKSGMDSPNQAGLVSRNAFRSDSLQPHGPYSPWNSPGQNTAVGSLSLLQGIFPTKGLNSGLPHGRRIFYQLSLQGSPRILEWVAYPFSSESFQSRNRTGVSCIAGELFLPTELSGKPKGDGSY